MANTSDVIDATFGDGPIADEPQEGPAALDQEPPPPDLLAEVRRYYTLLRAEHLRSIAEIETFLGFAESSDDLAVRVAKLENFVGIKR